MTPSVKIRADRPLEHQQACFHCRREDSSRWDQGRSKSNKTRNREIKVTRYFHVIACNISRKLSEPYLTTKLLFLSGKCRMSMSSSQLRDSLRAWIELCVCMRSWWSEGVTVRMGIRDGDITSQWCVHESSSHATRDEITPTLHFNATHVAQIQTYTAGHCKHPLWHLYNLCSIQHLWPHVQIGYQIMS